MAATPARHAKCKSTVPQDVKLPPNWGKVPGAEDAFPGKMETILDEAARITCGDRQRDYAHPYPNHQRIARLWNAYMDCRREPHGRISPGDVATMMILLKIARNVFTTRRDNLVDICGYARCLEQIADYTEAAAENP